MMHFRRHTIDLGQSRLSLATSDDLTDVVRLLIAARSHQISTTTEDLSALIGYAPSIVLRGDGQLWGAVIAGRPNEGRTWLRATALADGAPLDTGLALLLEALHTEAASVGVTQIYYGGDSIADSWMAPRLYSNGYVLETYVITYAKEQMTLPDHGAQDISLRAASAADLPSILEIDRRCFEPQWTKEAPILAPAIQTAGRFMIAEIDQAPVGYTCAMSYYGGRHVHLVRIAVIPEMRGRGIGVRLLADIVEYARQSSTDTLTLNTQEYNTAARRLYEWFGFRQTGERQLIMRHDITPTNKTSVS
jgi:[ribosomal protein S18]-alanine N-acetyltransferase